jgi:4-hydroxy-4-methyl-2-oxoglutarate aldolase
VQVGDVTVRTGDLVVGDADGVVVLPHEVAALVIDSADERVAKEADIMRWLHAGESTLDIYGLREAGRG